MESKYTEMSFWIYSTLSLTNDCSRWEGKQSNMGEEMLISAEDSVMANFDFLSREEDIDDEDEVRSTKSYDFVFLENSIIYILYNIHIGISFMQNTMVRGGEGNG